MPEPVREWQEAQTSDSPDKFWDQMANMRSRMGNSIRIPGPDAGEDAMNEFYSRLQSVGGVTRIPEAEDGEGWGQLYNSIGRPEKPEEYKFDASDDVKALYHGLGLSEAQAARLVEAQQEEVNNRRQADEAAIQSDYEALIKEWGDAHGRKMAGIKAFLDKYDEGGAMADALKDPKFPHAASLLRTLGKAGDAFLETLPPDAGGQRGGWGITPDEARERANEMLHNPDSPRNNPNHPNHQAAQKEYMRLRRIATGEARA